MKKKVFLFGILFLIFILPLILAAENDTSVSDSAKVSKAYECLNKKIDDKKCDNLGFEEKVFSLLATGECKSELVDDGKNEKCWPKSACTIKSTAQAVIALERTGGDTDEAVDWLLDQKTTPSDLTWYLQIESPEETKCKLSYDNKEYNVVIDENKQISSNAGSCLTLSEGKYWLRVAPSCYEEEFEISCDKRFLTNLLFKQAGSSTIHVSPRTTESSANGMNTEKVESFCLGQNNVCNYEANLWAAMALKYTDNNFSSYIPYLITLSEDENNAKFIPESFLYYLTGSYDFRNALLTKQMSNKYWDVSGDKFFDTALALLPIEDEPTEKTNAKSWLLDSKTLDADGCWKGSIMSTAFILYSVWPSAYDSGGSVTIEDCETKSGFCISSISCTEASGSKLNYFCPGMAICCNKDKSLDSCFDQGGEICDSNENCAGGTTVDASDTGSEGICCVRGECVIPAEQTECAVANGICKLSCADSEESITMSCDSSSDVCCVEKTSSEGSSLWVWILTLGILILLVIFAILFKDKLRAYWIAFSGKGKPASAPRGGPFLPPSNSSFPIRGVPPRRVLPPSNFPQRSPVARPAGEMEDVLKKLKEMGR